MITLGARIATVSAAKRAESYPLRMRPVRSVIVIANQFYGGRKFATWRAPFSTTVASSLGKLKFSRGVSIRQRIAGTLILIHATGLTRICFRGPNVEKLPLLPLKRMGLGAERASTSSLHRLPKTRSRWANINGKFRALSFYLLPAQRDRIVSS